VVRGRQGKVFLRSVAQGDRRGDLARELEAGRLRDGMEGETEDEDGADLDADLELEDVELEIEDDTEEARTEADAV
jgi:hypothetical protein